MAFLTRPLFRVIAATMVALLVAFATAATASAGQSADAAAAVDGEDDAGASSFPEEADDDVDNGGVLEPLTALHSDRDGIAAADSHHAHACVPRLLRPPRH